MTVWATCPECTGRVDGGLFADHLREEHGWDDVAAHAATAAVGHGPSVCELCGEPIGQYQTTAAWIVGGWVTKRSQGGTNHVTDPVIDARRAAHDVCVKNRVRRGQTGLDL